MDIVSFIKRRAIRIFPLYYLSIFFLIFMDYIGSANIPNCAYPFALTYTTNFINKGCDHSTISHFWSLSVEEHFYLFWPLIFTLGKRVSAIAAGLLVLACLNLGTTFYSHTDGWYPNRWTFPAMLPILCGCLTAILHKHWLVSSIFEDKTKSNIVLISIIAGLCSPAFISSYTPWLLSICSLLVYIKQNQDSTLVRVLEFKPLAMIGIISYGLYVWQGIFTGNGPYRTGAAFPPPLYTGLWLTFLVAPLSYVLFERPLLKLKDKYSWQREKRDKNDTDNYSRQSKRQFPA
ncbi:MAG: acyltransferase [Pseudomonas sp.]|nr:acyltransferase [Pseudomonas sp.]